MGGGCGGGYTLPLEVKEMYWMRTLASDVSLNRT